MLYGTIENRFIADFTLWFVGIKSLKGNTVLQAGDESGCGFCFIPGNVEQWLCHT